VSSAPAVTCLVQAVIEADGGEPSADEAELLLFGLCTDTGFFRHLDERGAEAFAQASRLIRVGASPKRAFAMMSGGKPLASRKLLGELLFRAEAYYEGRLLVSYMNLEDHARYGLVGRDSDMLYQLLMTVEGVEAAAVIRQEKPGECTVGFRSKERIDVAAVAAGFGGGGHRLAAGLHLAGELADVKALIIASFSEPMRTLDGLSNQS
jgi:phosphoesterase RecJ-like protein